VAETKIRREKNILALGQVSIYTIFLVGLNSMQSVSIF
jgi:hypothetical protein